MGGLILALNQVGMLSRSESPDPTDAPPPAEVGGSWSAEVNYPWGVSMPESFDFRVEGDRVIGTATYLGYPRAVESGSVTADRITFSTRAEEILGDERRAYENHYDGLVSPRGIQFVLVDSRGNGPIEFTARKNP